MFKQTRRPALRRYHLSRPRLQWLEPRAVPAIMVTTNFDNVPGSLSLRAAILEANNTPGLDTIEFDSALTGANFPLDIGSLVITESVIINGPTGSTVFVDAKGKSRVFVIDVGIGSVTMSNLTVTNGAIENDYGGGILITSGTVSLTNVSVFGNKSDATATNATVNGAGICLEYGTLTLTSCDVSGNSATATGSNARASGGGIAVVNGVLRLISSSVSFNKANDDGGGVFVVNAEIELDDTDVIGNTAGTSGRGGGLCVLAGPVSIDDSSVGEGFTGNTAGGAGGGIYAVNGSLLIEDSHIHSNSAGTDGGGIYHDYGNVTVLKTQSAGTVEMSLKDNLAGLDGGGIYTAHGTVTVTRALLDNNMSKRDGGGIFHRDAALTLDNSQIVGNDAFARGAGICILSGSLTASDTLFELNSAFQPFVATVTKGGAVYSEVATTLTDCTTNKSLATVGGGFSIATALGSLVMTDCTLSFDQATTGGGVYLYNVSTTTRSKVIDSTFTGCGATITPINPTDYAGGGLASIGTGNLEIVGGSFTECQAGEAGGGVFISPHGAQNGPSKDISISGVTFLNNRSQRGVGLAIVDSSTTVSVTNCSFKGGMFYGNGNNVIGAGLFIGGKTDIPGTVAVIDCPFDANIANFGGGIGILGSNATVSILKSSTGAPVVMGNGAALGGLGGGLYVSGVTSDKTSSPDDRLHLTVTGITFAGNSAALSGGGVCITQTDAVVALSLCAFLTNTASAFGGAIAINGTSPVTASAAKVTIDKCTVEANTATGIGGMNPLPGIGGGIDVGSRVDAGQLAPGTNAIVAISDCTITTNNASSFGGGIAVNASFSPLTITNCTVANNKTNGFGGGIATDGNFNNVTIVGSTLEGNTAASGGGLSLNGVGSFWVRDSLLAGNNALAEGGGAYCATISSGKFTNTTVSGNGLGSVGQGGGIFVAKSAGGLTVNNSTIAYNMAGGGQSQGGGIFYDGEPPTVSVTLESTIVGNNLAGQGWEVYGAFNIAACLFGKAEALSSSTYLPLLSAQPIFETPVKIDGLQFNGGPTRTHRLLADSDGVNSGSNPDFQTYDQRQPHFRREVPLFPPEPDIGAYEIQPIQLVQVKTYIDTFQNSSRVNNIVVTFDSDVLFEMTGAPFILVQIYSPTKTLPTPFPTVGLVVGTPSANSVTITFNGTGSVALDPGSSLPDGLYRLTAVADQIYAEDTGHLDGDRDGVSEGSPIDNATALFHRLFGDDNDPGVQVGDTDVDNTDFIAFRNALGLSNLASRIFDFDGDGDVDNADFTSFRARFGIVWTP